MTLLDLSAANVLYYQTTRVGGKETVFSSVLLPIRVSIVLR